MNALKGNNALSFFQYDYQISLHVKLYFPIVVTIYAIVREAEPSLDKIPY
jgi:hypothetical protein